MDSFTRSGLTFEVADSGPPDGAPIILLHGFPQTHAAWARVTPELNASGYRTLAPDQRGYSPGARPTGRRAYRITELVDDVLALADAAGVEQFHLVGHDWGAIVAWHLAAGNPDRLTRLTVLSVPHPNAFRRALLTSRQALRSWYVVAFQAPRLPERAMLRDGGAALRRTLLRSGMDEDALATTMAWAEQPGALTAAVNWYRALPLSSMSLRPIRTPTLYVWSTDDFALDRTGAELTGRYVAGPYTFETLAGSHWIPEEHPAELVRLLLQHDRARA